MRFWLAFAAPVVVELCAEVEESDEALVSLGLSLVLLSDLDSDLDSERDSDLPVLVLIGLELALELALEERKRPSSSPFCSCPLLRLLRGVRPLPELPAGDKTVSFRV